MRLWNANRVIPSPDLWFQMRTHLQIHLRVNNCEYTVLRMHLSARVQLQIWRSRTSSATKIHFLRSRKFLPQSTHRQPMRRLQFYNHHNQRYSVLFFLWLRAPFSTYKMVHVASEANNDNIQNGTQTICAGSVVRLYKQNLPRWSTPAPSTLTTWWESLVFPLITTNRTCTHNISAIPATWSSSH